jgi:hypothetical protein
MEGVLTEECNHWFAFKFGTPLLQIFQEFQGRNRKGASNCASGPILTAEINHDDAFLVPWRCDENPRSLSKSCLVSTKQCTQKVHFQKGVYLQRDHKVSRPFPNLFQKKKVVLEKTSYKLLQICGFMMR